MSDKERPQQVDPGATQEMQEKGRRQEREDAKAARTKLREQMDALEQSTSKQTRLLSIARSALLDISDARDHAAASVGFMADRADAALEAMKKAGQD